MDACMRTSYELRPKTGILRTIVEINDQLTKVSESVLICIPPLLEIVGDEVTRSGDVPKAIVC